MFARVKKILDYYTTPTAPIPSDSASSQSQESHLDDAVKRSYLRIKVLCYLFGIVGFLAGVIFAMIAILFANPRPYKAGVAPIVLGGLGVFIGWTTACLFAPTVFFDTADGKIWLNRIGVKTAFGARVVCFAFLLFWILVPVFISIAIYIYS